MKKVLVLSLVLFALSTCKKENTPPQIEQIVVSPSVNFTSDLVFFNCVSFDVDGDQLSYSWSANGGSFIGSSSTCSATWKAPDIGGDYTVKVFVSDGKSTKEKNQYLRVKEIEGAVSGHVYFSGTTIPISGVTIKIGNLECATDADGKFLIKSKSGVQIIQATKEGFDDFLKKDFVDNKTTKIDLEMTSSAFTKSVSGTIKNEKGETVSGIKVVIMNPDNTESKIQTISDENGNFRLQSVPQGDRQIVFKRKESY